MVKKKQVKKASQGAPVFYSKGVWAGFGLLLVVLMLSATGVVYSSHTSRHLLNELQQLERQRNDMQVQWGQLLLEQSSLVSQGRVEDISISQLGMEIPAIEQVVVITSD